MYTREEIKKIIEDYEALCKYTESLVMDNVAKSPLKIKDDNLLVDVYYYWYGEREPDVETIPLDYYSMTAEQVKEDRQKRKEELRLKAEEELRKHEEEFAKKSKELEEKKLVAELKSKYDHLGD